MKAVQLHAYGGVDQLRYEDVPTPEPGDNQVLIKVAATSINPIDWKIRNGEVKDRFPVTFPFILGRDVAGTVMSVGTNVRTLHAGQKVMGLVSHSYADCLVADADDLTVVPDGLDLEACGALPLVTTTGGQLIKYLELQPGQTVLVTGALGSVGRSAVFLARQMGANVVVGVREIQREQATELQADLVVAIDDDIAISKLPQLDAIADTVGHEIIGKLIPKLKPGGVLGSVLGPPKEAEGKGIRVEAFSAQPDASLLRQMADAVRDQKLVIPIAKTMKLSEVAEAQTSAEKGSVGGKILLIP